MTSRTRNVRWDRQHVAPAAINVEKPFVPMRRRIQDGQSDVTIRERDPLARLPVSAPVDGLPRRSITTLQRMSERSGTVSVRLAMSLDGYIADGDGGYDWIVPVSSPDLDTAHHLPFDEFLADMDIVAMGRRCYEQGLAQDYLAMEKRVIVATTHPPTPSKGPDGIEFSDDVIGSVTAARDHGERTFVFGGGVLVHSFLASDAVDTLTVGIVPVLLGGGRPLFPGGHQTIDLRLTDYTISEGKVRLVYARR